MKGSKGKAATKTSSVAKTGGATASAQGNRTAGGTTSKLKQVIYPFGSSYFGKSTQFTGSPGIVQFKRATTFVLEGCDQRKLNSTKKHLFL